VVNRSTVFKTIEFTSPDQNVLPNFGRAGALLRHALCSSIRRHLLKDRASRWEPSLLGQSAAWKQGGLTVQNMF